MAKPATEVKKALDKVESSPKKAKPAKPANKNKVQKEEAATLSKSEIESMVRKLDFSSSDSLKNAFQKELDFRQATQKELHALIAQIKILCEKSEKTDLEKARKHLLEKMDVDYKLVQAFNATIAANKAKKGKNIPIPITDNKLCVKGGVIEGAKKIIEKHFFDICAGKIDDEYNFDSTITTVLGNKIGAKGNSKETHLKAALLAIRAYFSKELIAQMSGGKWIDTTPIASVHTIPNDFDLGKITIIHQDQVISFESCSYFYKDDRTAKGLCIPHSGYEFGAGHGNDPRYPQGKLLSSLDCSSSVSTCIGTKVVSTLDQMYYFKLKTKTLDPKSDWTKTPQCKSLEGLDIITDPAQVLPGDIYSYRKIDLDKDPQKKGDGTGGHTAIVTEAIRPDGKLWTIGWNRAMPNLEGIGLQEFNCKLAEVKPSFFRKKKS